MKTGPTIAAALFFPQIFFGQKTADTLDLPPVEVRAERLTATHNGLKTNELDTAAALFSTNLAEALADGRLGIWASPVGPGSLATLSARGAGAARTAVVWNGLPLQSTMNGVADGSLLSFFEGDRVAVQMGGASSLAGSGSIGGTVEVASVFPEKTGWSGSLGSQLGSFGAWREEASLFFKNKTGGVAAGLRGSFEQARNDFPFKNTARIGSPTVRQVNARFEKADVQQLARFFLNEKTSLTTALWLTAADRQIPPSMTEAVKFDRQLDSTARATAALFHEIKRGLSLRARGGWLYESILFSYAGGDERSRARTFLGEAEVTWAGRPRGLSAGRLGFFADRQSAFSDGYEGRFGRQNRAIFFSQKIDFQQVAATATGRLAFLGNGKKPVPTGSIGLEKKGGGGGLRPRVHVSRNYNLPTFNDRFWAEGGNPDLLPEASWSAEAGAFFECKMQNAKCKGASPAVLSGELTLFSMWIDDWIQWAPGADNPSIWRPSNHKKVRSAGIEAAAGFSKKTGRGWQFSIGANGRAQRLRNLKFYQNVGGADEPIRQPSAQAAVRASVEKGRWRLFFTQNWTAFAAELTPLGYKNYSTGSLGLAFSPKSGARLFVKTDNLWGANYQILPYRPMPGRSWRGGARFSF